MTLQTWCKIGLDPEPHIVTRQRKDSPEVATGADGNPVWRPQTDEGPRPAFDSSTHHAPRLVETIEASRVVRSWADPVAKTSQEIDDEKTSRATSEAERLLGQIVKRNLATMFAVINDIRSRHGQGAVTVEQFLNFWEGSADGISDAQFVAKMKELIG